MDKRKKILLGNKDINTRNIEDFSININLTRTYNEIVPGKFENKFDLLKQYKKERNLCRNFRIYGTIESVFIDCDELYLHIFKKEPDITHEVMSDNDGYIKTIKTSSVISNSWNPTNIFNKKKGKYLIELENYNEYDSVYIFISGLPENYNNLFKRQLIYRYETLNLMGEKTVKLIPYGKDEAIIDINGNILPTSNDFDFFYNKHWIKENIKLDFRRKTFWSPYDPYCETIEREIKWYRDENSALCLKEPYEYETLVLPSLGSSLIIQTASTLENTGFKKYENLIEVFMDTLTPIPNANTKPNSFSDPDYAPNIFDDLMCPVKTTPKTLTIINETNVNGYSQGAGFTKQTPLTNIANNSSPYDYKQTLIISAVPSYHSVFLGFEEYDINNINRPYFNFDFNTLSGDSKVLLMEEDKTYISKFAESVNVTFNNIKCYMFIEVFNIESDGFINDNGMMLELGDPDKILNYFFPKGIKIRIYRTDPYSGHVKTQFDGDSVSISGFYPQTGSVIDLNNTMAEFILNNNLNIYRS